MYTVPRLQQVIANRCRAFWKMMMILHSDANTTRSAYRRTLFLGDNKNKSNMHMYSLCLSVRNDLEPLFRHYYLSFSLQVLVLITTSCNRGACNAVAIIQERRRQ